MKAEEFKELTREYAEKVGEFVRENPEKRGLVLLAAFEGEESNTIIAVNGTGRVVVGLLSAAMNDDNLEPSFSILKLLGAMK